MALGFQSTCPNFVEKDLPGQARALGCQSGGAAVDVVVAGASGREFELSQPEGLGGQQTQQILTRGRTWKTYDITPASMRNPSHARYRR